jgi:hypothetical protein
MRLCAGDFDALQHKLNGGWPKPPQHRPRTIETPLLNLFGKIGCRRSRKPIALADFIRTADRWLAAPSGKQRQPASAGPLQPPKNRPC